MKSVFLFSIFIYFTCLIFVVSTDADCFQPHCSCDLENQILQCNNYNSFTQLDFKTNTIAWKEVEFRSNSVLKLNSNFNLDGLILNTTVVPVMRIYNINAFDIDYNPFRRIKFSDNGKKFSLIISQSRWLFESTQTPQNICLFSKDRDFLFSDLVLSSFQIYTPDFLSSARFCPLFFMNSKIDNFEISRGSGRINFVPVIFGDGNAEEIELGIKVEKLVVSIGTDVFPKIVTQDSLLNLDLFSSIKSLEFITTYLTFIDENILQKFANLKMIRFSNVRLDQLLNNGSAWLNNLNSAINFDLENTALTTEIIEKDAIKLFIAGEQTSNFEDEALCNYNNYPHQHLVVTLIEGADKLPCSCTVYWLFKYYDKYKNNLSVDEKKLLPNHCFEINPILVNEQLEICNIENQLNECSSGVTTESATTQKPTTKPTKSCIDNSYKCKCNFDFFNYLECSDPSLDEIPNDFTTADDVKWNYVTFVGSSITRINDFNSLLLDENAVIVVKNISTFGPRIFSKLITETNYQFRVEDSDLFTLGRNLVFESANLSNLEFTECTFSSQILVNAFEGATVDSFVIKRPKNISLPFQFRPTPLFKPTKIRKFKIDRAYDSFSEFFGIDTRVLPSRLFVALEELEISNTILNYIEPNSFEQLDNLKVFKLENVSLITVIQNDLYNEFNKNWLSVVGIEKFFIGREYQNGFTFQNEFICYFLDMHEDVNVYIYDSIDFEDGPNCTCTIYWLYRNLDFDALKNDPYVNYVPKCIQNLNNKQNILNNLNKCFNGVDVQTYCETQSITTTLKTTERPKSCIDEQFKCKCSITTINLLECNDPSITEIPNNFETLDEIKWNYVTFINSSITAVNDFNSLTLDENAIIIVRNISNFGSRLFSKVITETNYQFIVEESDLFSLGRNLVFASANLSNLEFIDCTFSSQILLNGFEGATVNSFLIKRPKNISLPFQFRPTPLFKETKIKKFTINDAYDSFTLKFGLDIRVLPPTLFNALEELEISNTKLSFIRNDIFDELFNFEILKLENIDLLNVISNEIDGESNWLSSKNIKKLFIGREYKKGFTFQDEYICYFIDMHEDMNVYIYDSIDFEDGPNCTCTIYWLYRNLDFEALKNDPYANYVPKCIKELKSSENLTLNLETCLNNFDSGTFCNGATKGSTTTTTKNPTTTTTTPTTSSTQSVTTVKSGLSSSLKESITFYGFIVIAALILIIFVILICIACKLKKINKLQKELYLMNSSISMDAISPNKRKTLNSYQL